MSGVGITGLIANLPGTLTPYPTQDPALEIGGFRQVDDTTARDAIPANFREIGMVVVTKNDGAAYQLVGGILNANWAAQPGTAAAQATANTAVTNAAAAQTTANTAVTNAATAQAAATAAQATATAAEQPFIGTYYVNPAFAGTSTGSASNPFTTVAACWAAAVALALAGAIVRIPPGVTVTENIVYPSTGGNWEIACDEAYASGSAGARITGTVTANSAAALSQFRLTRVIVNGAISGDISLVNGTAVLTMNRVRHTAGGISQTTTGGGTAVWVTNLIGDGAADENKQAGSDSAACVFAGPCLASNWTFDGSVSSAPNLAQFNAASIFKGCRFNVGGITNAGVSGSWHRFADCTFGAAVTMTSTNATNAQLDGASNASLLSVGLSFAGATTTVTTANSNASSTTTDAGNHGSTSLGARAPSALYELTFSLTLLVQGTAGLLQLNAIYTDMTGTLVVVPVGGTLDITAAVGTKVGGSLQFQHNGAVAPIAFSTTGITTAGAVSVAVAVALARRS